jgi:sulfite reductase alpha subunit-like flavoprotein
MKTILKINKGMKKYLLVILMMVMSTVLYAQPPGMDRKPNPERLEKIKALYVAFITQKLKLTPDEAQKFWPVHGQYEAELQAINTSGSTEIDREEAVLKAKKKYAPSFTKILGADRYNDFNIHDNAFREKIKARLREMQQRRKDKNGKGPDKDKE